MTPTEGATVTTTMERIEAALAHLAPDQQARDDVSTLKRLAESASISGRDAYGVWHAGERLTALAALTRIKARRDAAYRELFAAKVELMGRGEGTSAS